MNYQKIMDGMIEKIKTDSSLSDKKPRLLLHACCAPCSTYCMEYLLNYFQIDILFYNPNMDSKEEFDKRAEEMNRFCREFGTLVSDDMTQTAEPKMDHNTKVIVVPYDAKEFYEQVKGLEKEPEGGKRCEVCFRLRLEKLARTAVEGGYDFMTTSLSISPLKSAERLNEIGREMESKHNIAYLYSDFKKKNGYKRSVELSEEYNLYRQDYCGCIFSKRS